MRSCIEPLDGGWEHLPVLILPVVSRATPPAQVEFQLKRIQRIASRVESYGKLPQLVKQAAENKFRYELYCRLAGGLFGCLKLLGDDPEHFWIPRESAMRYLDYVYAEAGAAVSADTKSKLKTLDKVSLESYGLLPSIQPFARKIEETPSTGPVKTFDERIVPPDVLDSEAKRFISAVRIKYKHARKLLKTWRHSIVCGHKVSLPAHKRLVRLEKEIARFEKTNKSLHKLSMISLDFSKSLIIAIIKSQRPVGIPDEVHHHIRYCLNRLIQQTFKIWSRGLSTNLLLPPIMDDDSTPWINRVEDNHGDIKQAMASLISDEAMTTATSAISTV